MGIHFYNASTSNLETMETRLKPARAVTGAGIPCVIWAEDALDFAHFVPTSLFALQLIVPDEDIEKAAIAVTSFLPYAWNPTPPPSWLEYPMHDPAQPNFFPNSIGLEWNALESCRLEDDPKEIFIHPASHWNFDIRNDTRSMSLVPPLSPPNLRLRFPTRTAFLDAIIDPVLDPPIGFYHGKLISLLGCYAGYLMLFTLRNNPRIFLPNGDLDPEHAAVEASLKAENRHWFSGKIRRNSLGWSNDVKIRRAVLESLGRIEEARRPLPKYMLGAHRSSERTTLQPWHSRAKGHLHTWSQA